MLPLLTSVAAGLLFIAFVGGAIVSFFEREWRAAYLFLIFGVISPALFLIPLSLNAPIAEYIAGGLNILFYGSLLLSFVPFPRRMKYERIVPREKIDERDTMFSRNLLKPDSANFNDYYSKHPEKKPIDDKFRKNPGLLEQGTLFYHPKIFNTAKANFNIIENNRPFVDGKISEPQESVIPSTTTAFLKKLILKMGAHSVGVTKLKDYHLYSYRGRGHNYGTKVKNNHPYAIALTVEMDHTFMRNAPHALTVLESSRQYVRSGLIALQIAQQIRNLGYSARAHIDGEYQVVCPLVARDANLGEIGRMGLLMSPALGPRIRIAVITTSIPLIPDQRKEDKTVIDFCNICKKCADTCPTKAIPFDEREEIDGVLRWKINQEACFTYWTKAGTDCGKCMSVCPYSHPDNALHNIIRYGIKNSPLFRFLALKMDDFFYGRKPKPLKLPRWYR